MGLRDVSSPYYHSEREQQLREEQESAIRSPINQLKHELKNSSFGG